MIYYYNYVSDYQISNIPFDRSALSGRTIFSINSTKTKVEIKKNYEIHYTILIVSIGVSLFLFIIQETVFQKDFSKQSGIILFAFASIAYCSYLNGRSVCG